jgi:Tol biopolymer transport system component
LVLDTLTDESKVIATSGSQTRARGFFFTTWSLDSNQVAFFELQQGGGYSQLYLYNFENNNLTPILPEGTVPFTSLAWSVGDKNIFLPSHEKDKQGIYSFDIQTKIVNPIILTNEFPQNFVLSPSGKLILFELRDSNRRMKLCWFNIVTNEVAVIQEGGVPASSYSAYYATWSPDGNYIVYSTGLGRDWNLNIVEIKTGEKIKLAFPAILQSSANILWIYP